jgi:hypothetical protein
LRVVSVISADAEFAPEPARPMKCSVEMLETNSEPPLANQR